MSISKLPPEELRRHKGISFVGVSTVFFCHDGNGKFLMSKRSQNCRDEQGKWEIAAGGLKWGARAIDNMKRELKEEFDAEAISIKYLGLREIFRQLDDGTPTHWLTLDYAVEVDPAQVKRNEPDMSDAIGWYTLGNMPSPLHSQIRGFFDSYHDQLADIVDK